MQEQIICEVQMKNGMGRMEGDKTLNSSSRKDYTTQNEGKSKWGRTASSQTKNQTKSRQQPVATRPCYTLKCALLISFLCVKEHKVFGS